MGGAMLPNEKKFDGKHRRASALDLSARGR
jgi:hypothetical protein